MKKKEAGNGPFLKDWRQPYPFINGYEDQDGDNDDNFLDGRRDEDVVVHELGREVDAVGAAPDRDPDDHHEE